MRIKQLIGVDSEKKLYEKFPWLKSCKFEDAIIDASFSFLVWYDGEWRGGEWCGGEWRGGVWYDGEWHGGEWYDGNQNIRIKWRIIINKTKTITIGCETKTVKDWDEWFKGTDEFETERGTDDFKRIEGAYKALKVYGEHCGLL